jgi:hypothetical protein
MCHKNAADYELVAEAILQHSHAPTIKESRAEEKNSANYIKGKPGKITGRSGLGTND